HHLNKTAYQITDERVETASEMKQALEQKVWDIVISDYSLPQFDAPSALKILMECGLDIPFIVVSGTIGEDTAVKMMKSGAQDYLMKSNLTRLIPAINRELAEAKVRRQQKYAELALRESEAKLRAILENSVDAIGVSLNGIHVFENPAYLALFGCKEKGELLGRPIIDLIAPNERERIKGYIARRPVDLTVPSEYETRGLRENGQEFDMDIRVSLFEFNGTLHTLTIIRDITTRKESERALKRSYDELTTIYRASQKLQQLSTPDVLMSELVRILEETLTFAYGAVILIDGSSGNLVPYTLQSKGRDTEFMQEELQHIRSLGLKVGYGVTGWVALHGETVLIGDTEKDSRYIPVRRDVRSELCVPLKTKDKILGVVNVESTKPEAYTDSNRRVLEVIAAQMAIALENSHLLEQISEELRIRTKAEIIAEESNLMKSTLMMNMSHEVRTPMNAILGFSSLIHEDAQETDIREMAYRIKISGYRLMKTLDDILELTQLESGGEKLNREESNLADEMKKIVNKFEPAALDKNLFLNLKTSQPVISNIDQHPFDKAVSEIVGNAIKFTDEGGIDIMLDCMLEGEKPWAVIHIKDTGIGIAEEHLKIIFDSFRQVSLGYGRAYEGTGLGLTISKKIIELLNGEIIVESKPGLGSDFFIRIPCSNTHLQQPGLTSLKVEQTTTIPEKPVADNENDPLILLVEDNEDNIFVTREFCRDKYDVVAVKTGHEAIESAKKYHYDLILMDINLGPGIDGLETASEIKKIDGFETVPIVAMTGFTLHKDKARLLANGCDHYLGKPFTKKDLLEQIDFVLQTIR
ncbi:MAG: response regulator, partial [Bacteroidota bacterium]